MDQQHLNSASPSSPEHQQPRAPLHLVSFANCRVNGS
jgi:hypothetical protein